LVVLVSHSGRSTDDNFKVLWNSFNETLFFSV
jgi:hypothetical protein